MQEPFRFKEFRTHFILRLFLFLLTLHLLIIHYKTTGTLSSRYIWIPVIASRRSLFVKTKPAKKDENQDTTEKR